MLLNLNFPFETQDIFEYYQKHVDSNVSNALYVVCCRKSNDLWEVLHKRRYETLGYFWPTLPLPLSSHFHTFQCNFFGVTCPFWLYLLFSFFCHQVVILIHLDYLGEPRDQTHGSDCESSMFTTRPGSFPFNAKSWRH